MSPGNPEVGIALAAYRPDPEHFKLQLLSIQAQTFGNWICVITFDSDIVNPGITDSRFYFIQNKNRLGHVKNFEYASQKCLSISPDIKYIAFSDQDDIWYPKKLQTLVQTLESEPLFSGVHSNMNLLFSDGSRSDGWEYEGRKVLALDTFDLCLRNVCTGAASLFNANLFRQFPLIPKEWKDHDHWYAALAMIHGRLIPISEPLYDYRQHSSNVIGAQEKTRLLYLRRKWGFGNLLGHFIDMRDQYFNRISTLPITPSELRHYSNPSAILSKAIGSLLRGKTMLARSAIGVLFGVFLKRARAFLN